MTSVFDLPAYVGQRSATFRFKLVNGVTKQVLADLHPLMDQPPAITHDTSRTIKRNMTMLLGVEDTARVDIVQSRVLPYMVVNGVEYPLGRYLFTDATQLQYSQGSISNVTLLDEMYILDQPIEKGVYPDVQLGYLNIMDQLRNVLNPLGINYSVTPGTVYTTNGSWPVGTNRGNVLDDLALQGGLFSPWFDNTGMLRFVAAFDPATAVPNFDWDVNHVVVRGTMTQSSDLLSAPNRFIVISNSTSSTDTATSAIVGTYDVPDSAPWSIAKRGFVVPRIYEQGVDTPVQAQVIATTLGQRQLVFERYNLDTPPDPRHDSYDVIKWRGEKWLELGWTLTCQEGAPMQHVLRKAFS